MSKTTAEIVDEIVERLFTNGAGQEASRLLLIANELRTREVSVNNASYLGGWNRDAVRRVLTNALSAASTTAGTGD